MSKPRKPWYEAAFEADYLARYAHRSDRSAAAEVAFLVRVLGLPKGARVLDLCCGAGRHSRALAAKGFRVVGLDLSMDLLRAGWRRTKRALPVRADARRLPFAACRFDGVVNLFTSFGYFDMKKDDLTVLRNVARVLCSNGVLVLDFLNLQPTLEGLVPRTERRVGRARVVEQRRFDKRRKRLEKRICIEEPGRPARELCESVRAYTPRELAVLLAAAGLTGQEQYGDLRGAAFDEVRSPRCVWVARKEE
jgi:ubiquinone/menaquinone biosynthesis C-methylase UbiE